MFSSAIVQHEQLIYLCMSSGAIVQDDQLLNYACVLVCLSLDCYCCILLNQDFTLYSLHTFFIFTPCQHAYL